MNSAASNNDKGNWACYILSYHKTSNAPNKYPYFVCFFVL
jgi:hypothetical protein